MMQIIGFLVEYIKKYLVHHLQVPNLVLVAAVAKVVRLVVLFVLLFLHLVLHLVEVLVVQVLLLAVVQV